MTRFRTILAATALVASPFAAAAREPAPAPAQGAQAGNFELCAYFLAHPDYAAMNLGECLSYNSVAEPGFAPHGCDALREFELLALFGYDSYSECVRDN